MNGKLHLLLGTTAGIVGASCLLSEPVAAISYCGFCMIGSLFPDLDQPNSMLGKYSLGLSSIINRLFGHRGLFHTPFILFLIHIIYRNLSESGRFRWPLIGFGIGFCCHLLQDIMTKGGIRPLYPFSKKRFALTKFKSNHKIHRLFTAIFMVLVCCSVPIIIKQILFRV